MKKKLSIILGIYDLILAFGAVYSGLLMVNSKGVFFDYSSQWAANLPFSSWVLPGIIAIAVFGLGNVAAAIFSFRIKNNKSWFPSALAGVLLLTCVIFQLLVLREWYLATVEFLLVSIVQLSLSGFSLYLK